MWLPRAQSAKWYVMAVALYMVCIPSGQLHADVMPIGGTMTETGALTGVVTNQQGHVLRGALVRVPALNRSESTNDRGEYRFDRLPEGEHELVVTYLGYGEVRRTVQIGSAATKRLNLEMEVSAIALAGVQVSVSERYTQSDAINEQRTAASIRNIVSREQMERFPDAHVPDAIRRIPGVAVSLDRGEPSGIYVRGLSPSMTTVEIDGQRVPSTSNTGRAASLGGINAEMIESLELVKAVTPDMDADATAGAIRLRSRRPASSSLQGNLNTDYQTLTGEPGYRGSLSYANRIGATSFVLGANYSEQDHTNDDLQYTWRNETFEHGEERILNRLRVSVYPERRVRSGLDGRVEHRLADHSLFFVRGLSSWHSQRAERHRYQVELHRGTFTSPTEAIGGRAERQSREYERNRNIHSLTTGGEHQLSNLNLDYALGWSRSIRHEPYRDYLAFRHSDGVDARFTRDDRLLPGLEFINGTSVDQPEDFALLYFETRPDFMRDHERTAQVNLELPFDVGNSSGSLRVGGKWADKDRVRDYPRVRFEDMDLPFSLADMNAGTPYGRPIADGRYDLGEIVNWTDARAWVAENRDLMASRADRTHGYDVDDYEAGETVAGGYFMGTLDVGPVRFIGGARYENTRLRYLGNQVIYDDAGDYRETIEAGSSQNYGDLFPMLNARWELSDNSRLQASWSNTIIRPSFISIAPYEVLDFEDQSIRRGNPELPPARSINLDLMLDHYFQSVGFLSAGVFMKRLADFPFTFRTTIDDPASPFDGFDFREPAAGDAATVYGAEMAWQQQLQFLPGHWSGLGIHANYTWTGSSTDFGEPAYDERNLPMPRQVPHIANLGVTYDLGGFSGTVSWNYQGTQLYSVEGNAENDRWLDSRYQLDLSASQQLRSGLRLIAEVNNLTGQDQLRYRGTEDFPDRYNIYGTRLQTGVRWSF
ncbi:MAG: TonB-dependent receptor [Gemmatimonadales bacterium]|nr:MAG: TonB-dependent receptor [Gemmatimonadales bacterium]